VSSLTRKPAVETPRFWIGVAAQDKVELAIAGAYVQLNRGRAGPLERMRAGDGFAWYSPRVTSPRGMPLQAFTALGRVRDGGNYHVDTVDGLGAFRPGIEYLQAQPAPIRPLLDQLSFIRSKLHPGAAFRFGFLRVPANDFASIAAATGRTVTGEFGMPS